MINKLTQYIKESRDELKKVVWLTRKELTNHTLVVIGVSLGVAAFLGLIDFGLTKAIELFIK